MNLSLQNGGERVAKFNFTHISHSVIYPLFIDHSKGQIHIFNVILPIVKYIIIA